MRTVITELAKLQIRQTARYIRKEFGKKRCDEFMLELRQTRRLIERSPDIGIVEPLFERRAFTYRAYVMNRLNKIVYRINGNVIEIVAFWDVRRDPDILSAEVY